MSADTPAAVNADRAAAALGAARLTVCPVGELPPGQMTQVEVPGGEPIAVYNVDGIFHATADTCTHALASLTEGDLEDDEVTCPVHWARFNVRTGQPLCFPATVALDVYQVEVTDGMVTVLLPETPGNSA